MAGTDDIRAGGAAIEFHADLDKLEKETNSIPEMLKHAFGRGSMFKEALELAVGGGALASVSEATARIAELAKKANELREEFRSGSKSAGEIADELLRSLPILGNVYSAGREIRELFTGEEAEVKEITEQVARLNAEMDATKKIIDDGTKALSEQAKILGAMRHDGSLIGATEGHRQIQGALDKFGDDLDKNDEAALASRKTLEEDKKPLSDQKKQIENTILELYRNKPTASAPRYIATPTGPMRVEDVSVEDQLKPWREKLAAAEAELSNVNRGLSQFAKDLSAIKGNQLQGAVLALRNLGLSMVELAKTSTAADTLKAWVSKVESVLKAIQKPGNLLSPNASKHIDDVFNTMKSEADAIVEQNKTPAEHAQEEADKAKKLEESGLLSPDEYQKAVQRIAKEMQDSLVHTTSFTTGTLGTAAASRGYLGQGASGSLEQNTSQINESLSWIVTQLQAGNLTLNYGS